MKIVHFLGYSNSGKTTAISILTRELKKVHKNVGTLKHVHKHDFSLDKEGKDSKIQIESGASIVITISSNEFVVIKDRAGNRARAVEKEIDEAIRLFKKEKTDFLLIEGFNSISKRKYHSKQILCVKDSNEFRRLLKIHRDVDYVIWRGDRKARLKMNLSEHPPILFLPENKVQLIRLIS